MLATTGNGERNSAAQQVAMATGLLLALCAYPEIRGRNAESVGSTAGP